MLKKKIEDVITSTISTGDYRGGICTCFDIST